MAGKLFGR